MAKQLTERQRAALAKHAVKPGQVLNPYGRRGADVVRSALIQFLQQPHAGKDYTRLQGILYALYGRAVRGDVQAAKLLLSYVESPPAATNTATLDRDQLGRVIITWGAASAAPPAPTGDQLEAMQDQIVDDAIVADATIGSSEAEAKAEAEEKACM